MRYILRCYCISIMIHSCKIYRYMSYWLWFLLLILFTFYFFAKAEFEHRAIINLVEMLANLFINVSITYINKPYIFVNTR